MFKQLWQGYCGGKREQHTYAEIELNGKLYLLEPNTHDVYIHTYKLPAVDDPEIKDALVKIWEAHRYGE